MEETLKEKPQDIQEEKELTGIKGFFRRHLPEIGMVVLIMYVILLGIGVAAELFKIQWILDWWIFRCPGQK